MTLSYLRNTNHEPNTEQLAGDVKAFYDRNTADLGEFESNRKELRQIDLEGSHVRWAAIYAVASIQTDTDTVDGHTADLTGGFDSIKSMLEVSTDGRTKWEHQHPWFTSDEPDIIATLLNEGRVMDAHARLAGRNHQTGEQLDKTYLRACKASFVLYLLGYYRTCFDRRIFTVLRESGTLLEQVKPGSTRVAETAYENPYAQSYNMGKEVDYHRHKSVDEINTDFWCDKLSKNPVEYHKATSYVIDAVSEHTDVERSLIPQILFNLGRNDGQDITFHTELYDILL